VEGGGVLCVGGGYLPRLQRRALQAAMSLAKSKSKGLRAAPVRSRRAKRKGGARAQEERQQRRAQRGGQARAPPRARGGPATVRRRAGRALVGRGGRKSGDKAIGA
jgi:hypothetical protein